MIKSKSDYLYYLEQDRIARGMKNPSQKERLKDFIKPKPTWEFQQRLRKYEYYLNCKKGFIDKIILVYLNYRFRKLSLKLNFSIPPNVFGPGLCILHQGTIVINTRAKIGKNCKVEVCVVVGASGGPDKVPIIGDNVYIGTGAKIYGNIKIPNNVAIAANTAVNKSFNEENILIGGVPGKKIKNIDIKNILKHI